MKAANWIWLILTSTIGLAPAALNAAPRARMATPIPASLETPDRIDSPIGELKFSDGRPDAATVTRLYDNLDFQRGTQAFLNTNAAVSMVAMRKGLASQGADNQTVVLFETLTDSKSLYLTANTDTVYAMGWIDTRDGPVVIEVPPNFLGLVDDAWQRYVGDMGNAGPDRGKGGKYLLLPPGYQGTVPEGYYPLKSTTYGNWVGGRGFVRNGNPQETADIIEEHYRTYPLAQAANPPPTRFVNGSGKAFNTTFPLDFGYWEYLDEVVQGEPLEAVDAEIRGQLASIGIRKGQPFAPDARMKKILTDAVHVGTATARAILYDTREKSAYLYPDSDWRTAFIGGDHRFMPGGVLDPEARAMFFFCCTGITPAMALKMVGVGSQYAVTSHDVRKKELDGGKTYRVHLPAGIPAKDFWSLTVYDPQTRSYLQTDQVFPSIGSQRAGVVVNPDTSVDIWFGPKPPPGKEANWVQTWPGKGWFAMLRLYGPLESWFDKSWRPGEIEEIF